MLRSLLAGLFALAVLGGPVLAQAPKVGTMAPQDNSIRAASTEYVDRMTTGRNAREFGVQPYPANSTAAWSAALAWLQGGPDRRLEAAAAVYLVDGLSLDACLRCSLEARGATFLWSGNTRLFSDTATGVLYPQTVFLLRGDWSNNRQGVIRIGGIDGWNLGSDGLFVAAGYSHKIEIGSIVYARYGLNYSPHMNYGSETTVDVGLINRVVRGIHEAPGYLYAAQGLTGSMFFSQLTENTRFNVPLILNCKEYGIYRPAPSVVGSQQSGSNTTNYFSGAVDCTDYYDRTVDPLGGPTGGDYKGLGAGAPIQSGPDFESPIPGLCVQPTILTLCRPAGILYKNPAAAGAIDIFDNYENLSAPNPTTSRSSYKMSFLGNSMYWLADLGNGGAGLSRSNIEILAQDQTKIGRTRIDGYVGTVYTSCTATPCFASPGFSVNNFGGVTASGASIRPSVDNVLGFQPASALANGVLAKVSGDTGVTLKGLELAADIALLNTLTRTQMRVGADMNLNVRAKANLADGVLLQSLNDAQNSARGLEIAASTVKITGGPLQLPLYAFTSLPTCNPAANGNVVAVVNTTTPTYHGVIASGSYNTSYPAYCDGANWRAH